ncbi:MAG: LysR family transcriptional regulator [Sphingomonas bacterium]|nr:LysR family transcriptional regulator [Sphingomonas bacterium]
MSRSPVDLDLLRGFVAVAEAHNMTSAAARLFRTPSAVSLMIKRLESQLELRLFDRSHRAVRLTAGGEQLLTHARRLLAAHDAMLDEMTEPALEGVVRLGTPEDFATSYLPDVLARFAQSHPRVALEVSCELTLNLIDTFERGGFDLVLIKRDPAGSESGVRVWREPLVWVAGPELELSEAETLPLVVSPSPCVYRARAVGALDRAHRKWRISYTCGSLAGSQAAVRAGLGVTVLPRDMVPADLRVIDDATRLPDLHDTEIALLAVNNLSVPARRLVDHIVRALEHNGPRRN